MQFLLANEQTKGIQQIWHHVPYIQLHYLIISNPSKEKFVYFAFADDANSTGKLEKIKIWCDAWWFKIWLLFKTMKVIPNCKETTQEICWKNIENSKIKIITEIHSFLTNSIWSSRLFTLYQQSGGFMFVQMREERYLHSHWNLVAYNYKTFVRK